MAGQASQELTLPQPPLIFDPTIESLIYGARDVIASTKRVWDEIVLQVTPDSATIKNVVIPIALHDNEARNRSRHLRFVASTGPTQETRQASRDAANMLNEAEVDCYLRQDMFDLVDAVVARTQETDVDPEIYRFLTKFHYQFKKTGCGLPDGPRQEFQSGLKRLQEITGQALQNLHEDKSGIWLSPDELDGVDADLVQKLKIGEGNNAGKVWLTFKNPHLTPVMQFATSESTRRKAYTCNENRMNMNIPLYREIILLRDSLARLLGYPDHATFKTADKTVQSPKTVTTFLEGVRSRLTEKGQKEVQDLLQLKIQDPKFMGNKAEARLYHWDTTYYGRVKDDMASPCDLARVSEYFELQTVLPSLMSIYERLFDIRFEYLTPEKRQMLAGDKADKMIWHEEVKPYIVWDHGNSDRFLGFMYFDLHPREGKYSHSGHYSLQLGYLKPDGGRHYPHSVVVMNFPPSTKTQPGLLSLGSVQSLFHELGHGLHNVLSETKFARFHGVMVEKDFVETPSITFENFMWTYRHINEVSFHYSYVSEEYKEHWKSKQQDASATAPRQLPDDVIRALLNSKEKNKPLNYLRQLHWATYDMMVHTPPSREVLESYNFCELFNKTRREFMAGVLGGEALGEGWEWAHGESTYRALIGSYDAGYYAYIMGRAWAADIFETNFAADTLNKEAGRKYREMILKPGGSQPEMKTLTDFLGREPQFEAFYKWVDG